MEVIKFNDFMDGSYIVLDERFSLKEGVYESLAVLAFVSAVGFVITTLIVTPTIIAIEAF